MSKIKHASQYGTEDIDDIENALYYGQSQGNVSEIGFCEIGSHFNDCDSEDILCEISTIESSNVESITIKGISFHQERNGYLSMADIDEAKFAIITTQQIIKVENIAKNVANLKKHFLAKKREKLNKEYEAIKAHMEEINSEIEKIDNL